MSYLRSINLQNYFKRGLHNMNRIEVIDKEFKLFFDKDETGNWKYSNFARLNDRAISQQKAEIQQLKDDGVIDGILRQVEKRTNFYKDSMAVRFTIKGDGMVELEVVNYNMEELE